MYPCKCAFCSAEILVDSMLFTKTSLCDNCLSRDDITIYHHKWILLEEAEKLESERLEKRRQELNVN